MFTFKQSAFVIKTAGATPFYSLVFGRNQNCERILFDNSFKQLIQVVFYYYAILAGGQSLER